MPQNHRHYYNTLLIPYAIWKHRFIVRHECSEENFHKILASQVFAHTLSVLILCAFVAFSTIVFRHLDEAIASEPIYESLLFSFTTITTIGYGKTVPTNVASRAFCIGYCLLGIPMLFLTLSNVSALIGEFYWACSNAFRQDKNMCEFELDDRLPLKAVLILIILHSLIGGFIFHEWIDEMPLISAIYFSFISITTIGYGDLNPTPDNGYHTGVLIIYLSVGIVIMSTLFAALSGHIRQYSKRLYDDHVEYAAREEELMPSLTMLNEDSTLENTGNHDDKNFEKSCSENDYWCFNK